jgi:cell wall-associated NlpC family hydrolase
MQEQTLGREIDIGRVRRGDLVFWPGHVAIARDGANFIHANAFHMAVAVEPIARAIARITAAGSHVTSVRRPL